MKPMTEIAATLPVSQQVVERHTGLSQAQTPHYRFAEAG
jgi:hypothetical protein